jgi:hypothetical protein
MTASAPSESGLDYFEARYLSSAQGRFTSVDPDQNLGLHLTDPHGRKSPSRSRGCELDVIAKGLELPNEPMSTLSRDAGIGAPTALLVTHALV